MALIYQNKVPASYRDAFVKKVREVSEKLDIDPNWLMAIMYFESAGTFSPSIQNNVGATGLIQFMPKTAIGLGTTTDKLKQMSAVEQMDWVYKYYKPFKGKINGYIDTYLVTFFPVAVGKPDDYVMQTSNLSASLIAKQNPAFDTNKDGKIHLWEVKKVMLERLPLEWIRDGSFALAVKAYKNEFLIAGISVLAVGAITLYYVTTRK